MTSANDRICTSVKGGLGGQRGIWHRGANGITQTMLDYFKYYFWKNIFKIFFKKFFKFLKIFFILLYQGLCKLFQNKYNFQNFEVYINPFSVKKNHYNA